MGFDGAKKIDGIHILAHHFEAYDGRIVDMFDTFSLKIDSH